MKERCSVGLTLCNPMVCPWNSPGKNTAVGYHSLLQGIFPTWGSSLGLLNCRQILYHLSYQGNPLDSGRICKLSLIGEDTKTQTKHSTRLAGTCGYMAGKKERGEERKEKRGQDRSFPQVLHSRKRKHKPKEVEQEELRVKMFWAINSLYSPSNTPAPVTP